MDLYIGRSSKLEDSFGIIGKLTVPKPSSSHEVSSILYTTNNSLTEIRDLEIEDVQVLSHSKNVEDGSDKHLKALRPSQSLTILDFYS